MTVPRDWRAEEMPPHAEALIDLETRLGAYAGVLTADGDAAEVAFTVEHGMGVAPSHVQVTAGSEDAAGDFWVTADDTEITVTYATAPAEDTANVVLNWRAYP